MSILSRLIGAAVSKPYAFSGPPAECAWDRSGAPAVDGTGAPAVDGSGAPMVAPFRSGGNAAPAQRHRASRRHHGRSTIILVALTGALVLAFGAAPALGAEQYPFLSDITGASTTAGSFSSGAYSTAVDDVGTGTFAGDTLVADSGADLVYVFNSSGTLVATLNGSTTTAGNFGTGQITVAANNTSGDFYVTDNTNNFVDIFDSSGNFISRFNGSAAPVGPFSCVQGVAVDQSTSNVYVADPCNHVVDAFDSTGTFQFQITGAATASGSFCNVHSIAVDPTRGFIYAADSCNGLVYAFDDTGSHGLLRTMNGSNTPAGNFGFNQVYVAVNNGSGNLFVGDEGNAVVDAFDSSGNFIAQVAGSSTPHGSLSNVTGVSVDQASSQIYVSDSGAQVVDVFSGTPVIVPDVTTDPATSVQPTSAMLNGTVNPNSQTVTGCRFDWGRDTTYGNTIPCATTPSGSTPSPVSANLTGLAPNTTYHFRIEATANGITVFGGDQSFTTPGPPTIVSETTTNVGFHTATVAAQVNPNMLDTTVHFDYGTSTSYGSSTPDTDIGSGGSAVSATASLTGLNPGTTYHWRAVATNSAGPSVDGPDQTFTTYPSSLHAGLADGRAYEMATPVNKDSGEPFDRNGSIFGANPAAGDGNRVAYFSFNSLPGTTSFGSYYLATRGSSNWTSQNLIPPQSKEESLLCGALASDTPAYSPNLSKNILSDGFGQSFGCGVDSPRLVPTECAGCSNLFVHDNVSGNYQLVDITPAVVAANCPTNGFSSSTCIASFNAGSADLSHVVFDMITTPGLTTDAPPGVDNLYEWVASTNSVRLVTYLPNGTAVQGALAGGRDGYASHAMSDDGSKIFFTASNGVSTNLYVRVNGTSTQQVDAPASGASGPGGNGQFVAASSDGSKVFFTDDASAGLTTTTQSGSGANLYEYDVAGNTLTDLTPAGQAQVQGVSGVSDDGSYVYFVANGVLGSGATLGQENLYVIHNGGSPKFIVTLGGGDGCDWNQSCLTSRVSSNGQYIGFTSSQSLTGFNNAGNNEIFLYNAVAGGPPVCASCSPTGVPPTSSTSINGPEGPLESFAGINQYFQRQVSDNGQVFFNTTEPLLPFDTNSTMDVYEYANGTLSLISTGTSPDPSVLWDASPSGTDVFFATSQQLVPQDTDGSVDIYDARIGGGFPASAPAPSCQGESCKPPPTIPPVPPTVASITFSGLGNLTVTPGKVTTGSVGLLKRTVKGTRISLRIQVPASGQIVITGNGIARTVRTVGHAGKFTVIVSLTKRAANRLKHKRKLKLTIEVRYVPSSGFTSIVNFPLTVKA